MRVLVVDDEKLIRDVIKEYLLLENIEVEEASNGEEALNKVKQEDFDIIIMDIMMPKMDGYTACREIKKIKDIVKCLPENDGNTFKNQPHNDWNRIFFQHKNLLREYERE